MIKNLFLSVGSMKAGTTWLFENIKNHPKIYSTPVKEIHYFANKAGIENQLAFGKRLDLLQSFMKNFPFENKKIIANNSQKILWYTKFCCPESIDNFWYKSLFTSALDDQWCVDFSNLYCRMGLEGWKNVYKCADNVKVLYTLRDPLNRLWSHYKFHTQYTGEVLNIDDTGFEKFKKIIEKKWFMDNAEYYKNIINLRKYVANENLLILFFEDFRINPQIELEKLFNFLDISKFDGEIIESSINPSKELDMPLEWSDYAMKRLVNEYRLLRKINISHAAWNDI